MSLHIENYGEWHVGEEFDPLAIFKRVIKFQADGDELDFLLSTLHTYNKKAEATTLKLDGIDLSELKNELLRISNKMGLEEFPNASKLAGIARKSVREIEDIRAVSFVLGKTGKIHLIKEIRDRYKLKLLEAKLMADGIFRSNGWE